MNRVRLVLLMIVFMSLGGYLVARDWRKWTQPSTQAKAGPPVDSRRWQEVAAEFGWLLDFEEGRKLSASTGKPLMVVFRCIP